MDQRKPRTMKLIDIIPLCRTERDFFGKKTMNCPRCNSTRLHFHGTTKAGSDRYRCADCRKTFTPDKKQGSPGRKRQYASNADRMRAWRKRQKLNVKKD